MRDYALIERRPHGTEQEFFWSTDEAKLQAKADEYNQLEREKGGEEKYYVAPSRTGRVY